MQWGSQIKNQSHLHYLIKATVRKQPSVGRLQPPRPPPSGGNGLMSCLLFMYTTTAVKNAVPPPGHACSQEGLLWPRAPWRVQEGFQD